MLNDNVHLSKKLGYDGVHLGQNDMDCKNAREILGKNFSIGISCNNSIELAKKAKIDGADYVAFGPAFNSKTKKTSREVLNLEKLKKKTSVFLLQLLEELIILILKNYLILAQITFL